MWRSSLLWVLRCSWRCLSDHKPRGSWDKGERDLSPGLDCSFLHVEIMESDVQPRYTQSRRQFAFRTCSRHSGEHHRMIMPIFRCNPELRSAIPIYSPLPRLPLFVRLSGSRSTCRFGSNLLFRSLVIFQFLIEIHLLNNRTILLQIDLKVSSNSSIHSAESLLPPNSN